jgi:hypothetical protein
VIAHEALHCYQYAQGSSPGPGPWEQHYEDQADNYGLGVVERLEKRYALQSWIEMHT